MKRKIIEINEEKCNGCGLCVSGCPEGALQIVDGKARMVAEYFCDGLGACIGECPEGAIEIVEKEAEAYDEKKTMENIVPKGQNTIKAHLKHLKDHGMTKLYNQAVDVLHQKDLPVPELEEKKAVSQCCSNMAIENDNKTINWPIQLKLISPASPAFDVSDVVVAADCTAFANKDLYDNYLKGKAVIIFCPKLDNDAELYIDKLSMIFSSHNIKSITVLRMIVPCCGGTSAIVKTAMEKSGKQLEVNELIVSIDGNIK